MAELFFMAGLMSSLKEKIYGPTIEENTL